MRPHRFIDLTLAQNIPILNAHFFLPDIEQTNQTRKLVLGSSSYDEFQKKRPVMSARLEISQPICERLTHQMRSLNKTTELCRGLSVDHA